MAKYFQQPSVNSTTQHFTRVPAADIERSTFDRSHAHKTTLDSGYLVPVFVDEVLPGDTFNLHETTFARLATPLKPVMDNVFLETFYFFVPYRLCWDNWQAFMGERRSPNDDPNSYRVPEYPVDLSKVTSGTLQNYMGVPIVAQPNTNVVNLTALPFRAYWLIWNEWFRDQNLQDPVAVSFGDGPDTALAAITTPALRGKRHDYFTSALPWPQKGDPVSIPVGPIISDGMAMRFKPGPSGSDSNMVVTATNNQLKLASNPPSSDTAAHYAGQGLAVETSATINDLRTAFQIQKLLERDARGGTRYIEIILSHFGVRSDDARLQRPEYLGGGSTRLNISPVPATFRDTEVAQGDLGGYGTAVNRAGFSKSFTEHGIIIGLANVRADLTYQNGLERMWKRFTRYDFYWPAFAHLGEQIVANSEIFLSGTDVPDGFAWGYQERYAEYRYKPSRISGRFSSNDPASLDVWHLAQDFTALPSLNAAFISAPPPIDRIIAVPSEPEFLLDIWFQLTTARPMPVYSVPGLVDHF